MNRVERATDFRAPSFRFFPGERVRNLDTQSASLIRSLLLAILLVEFQPALLHGLSPNELVRKVVTNEMQAEDRDHTNWMYREQVNTPPPAKTRIVVETGQGELSCTEAMNGRPLSPQQKAKEERRIENFVSDPSQQRKARKAAEADDKKTRDLFGMLPDAFNFQVAETTGDTVKLTFVPNPAFHPRSMDANVFHRMEGFVIVNTRENRLVEISGKLTHTVEFGGGLLGHLDQGGTFDVQRAEIAPSHWAIAKMKVNMNGKALFFKTISVQQDEVHSDFHQVPDGISLAQAEDLLRKQPAFTGQRLAGGRDLCKHSNPR